MRKKTDTVNLATIAQELGISTATVSRALRNAPGIHPSTQEKILRRAIELGYAKMASRSPATRSILALAGSGNAESSLGYMTGISRASIAEKLAVLTHHVPAAERSLDLLEPRHQPAALRAGAVEGLILIHTWEPRVAAALSQDRPTVSIMQEYAGIDYVGIDDRAGMRQLAERLRAAGHRRLGFFGHCPEVSWASSRFGAYAEMAGALDSSAVFPMTPEEAASPTPFPLGDREEALARKIGEGVDAWICAGAMAGYSLVASLLQRGLPVPEAVSVAAFHAAACPPSSQLPRLTCVDVSDQALGTAALHRLAYRMVNTLEPRASFLLHPSLVEGETVR